MPKTLKIDTESPADAQAPAQPEDQVVAGFVPFLAREGLVTTIELVDALRETEGI